MGEIFMSRWLSVNNYNTTNTVQPLTQKHYFKKDQSNKIHFLGWRLTLTTTNIYLFWTFASCTYRWCGACWCLRRCNDMVLGSDLVVGFCCMSQLHVSLYCLVLLWNVGKMLQTCSNTTISSLSTNLYCITSHSYLTTSNKLLGLWINASMIVSLNCRFIYFLSFR